MKITTVAHSWCLVDNRIAVKHIDKTMFNFAHTAIPIDIQHFFGSLPEQHLAKKEFVVYFNSVPYPAYIVFKRTPHPEHTLCFPSVFQKILEQEIGSSKGTGLIFKDFSIAFTKCDKEYRAYIIPCVFV